MSDKGGSKRKVEVRTSESQRKGRQEVVKENGKTDQLKYIYFNVRSIVGKAYEQCLDRCLGL